MKKEALRTLKYVLFAASAGLIQIGSFALLNEFVQLNYWVCYLISLILSVIWNFTLNRRYTFKSTANISRAMGLVFAYYLVFTPASTYLEHLLTTTYLWNEYLVTILNMLLNFVTEFLFQRLVVYRGTVDTNKLAKKEAAHEEKN